MPQKVAQYTMIVLKILKLYLKLASYYTDET